jgi:hypothetical protein
MRSFLPGAVEAIPTRVDVRYGDGFRGRGLPVCHGRRAPGRSRPRARPCPQDGGLPPANVIATQDRSSVRAVANLSSRSVGVPIGKARNRPPVTTIAGVPVR